MRYKADCLYCGKTWELEIFYQQPEATCIICKDKNVKLKKISNETGDIFGYNNATRPDAYIKKDKK